MPASVFSYSEAITREEYYRDREEPRPNLRVVPEPEAEAAHQAIIDESFIKPEADLREATNNMIYDLRQQSWREERACKLLTATEIELFYMYTYPRLVGHPTKDGKKEAEVIAEAQAREERAKAICRDCPVIQECLADALKNQTKHEKDEIILGGQTTSERRAMLN